MECLHPSDFLHDFSSSYVSYTKSKQNSILAYYTLGLPGWLCTCCCVLCTGAEGKEGQVLVGIPIESNWLGTLCPLLSLDQVRGVRRVGWMARRSPIRLSQTTLRVLNGGSAIGPLEIMKPRLRNPLGRKHHYMSQQGFFPASLVMWSSVDGSNFSTKQKMLFLLLQAEIPA